MAPLDIRQIMKILPHRYPFVLVDKVVSKDFGPDAKSRGRQKIVALKNVTITSRSSPGTSRVCR